MSNNSTLKASEKLVLELETLGIKATVEEVKNNDWLAKVNTPHGPLAVYTNAKGRVTIQLNLIADKSQKILAASALDKLHSRARIKPVDSKTFIAYTDGSGQAGQCGWAMVLFGPNGRKEYEKSGNLGSQPSGQIAGEVEGAICAIQDAIKNGVNKILVRHDYEGVGKWGSGVWKNKDYDATRLKRWVGYSKNKGVHVRFEWTRGHNGDAGNERADVLAGKATSLTVSDRIPDPPEVIRLKGSEQMEFGL